MNVSIVGLEDSGRSTFLSLMYASQIRYTEETKGAFRFTSNPIAQAHLGEGYNLIRSGMWPDKKNTKHISFTFGYDLNSIGNRLKRLFNRNGMEPNVSMNFNIFEIPRNDELKLIEDSKRQGKLYDTDVLVIVLDASKIGKDGVSEGGISRIIQKLNKVKRGKVIFLVVWTKFDIVNRKRLKKIELLDRPPIIGKEKARSEYGNRILKRYYPGINGSLRNGVNGHFFVKLDVEKGEDDELYPHVSPDIETEIFYSYEEYRELIKHIGDIGKIDMKS